MLAQRVRRVVLPGQDPSQVRVVPEADPEHVEHLALRPLRAGPDVADGVDLERGIEVDAGGVDRRIDVGLQRDARAVRPAALFKRRIFCYFLSVISAWQFMESTYAGMPLRMQKWFSVCWYTVMSAEMALRLQQYV